MRIIEGQLVIRDERFCIIAGRFNESIVDKLVQGAVDTLKRHGADEAAIHLVRVPGCIELPLAAQRAAKTEPPGFSKVWSEAHVGLQCRGSRDSLSSRSGALSIR